VLVELSAAKERVLPDFRTSSSTADFLSVENLFPSATGDGESQVSERFSYVVEAGSRKKIAVSGHRARSEWGEARETEVAVDASSLLWFKISSTSLLLAPTF